MLGDVPDESEVTQHLVDQPGAGDLTAWMQTLALTGHQARRWEPKRLRLRLLSTPARHARTGRRWLLHLAAPAPFTAPALQALDALTRLTGAAAAPTPG